MYLLTPHPGIAPRKYDEINEMEKEEWRRGEEIGKASEGVDSLQSNGNAETGDRAGAHTCKSQVVYSVCVCVCGCGCGCECVYVSLLFLNSPSLL